MFDALLGRKFSVKCKQAIKRIKERLRLIRNRKQAMLNFLKQDIADLLRDGHESHALNRMDALIVEINHLACYNLIDKFCECILKQLSLLQKQRDCPPEDREAVSTLIFAAARFSDLPELCDLRHVFTTRYGAAMETYVNLEFKEKLASKSFLMASKIQLMRDIAREFSVNWDSESFEYRTDPMATECASEKNGRKSGVMDEPSINTVKHVVTEARDIHIISREPELTRKSKIFADEPENVNPYPVDTPIPHYIKPKKNNDGSYIEEDCQRKDGAYRRPSRAREVLDPVDQEYNVFEEMKSKKLHRARSELPPFINREPVGIDAEDWYDEDTIHSRSSRAQGEFDPICHKQRVIGQRKSKDENIDGNTVLPFIKRESNGIEADDWHHIDTLFKRSLKVQMQYKVETRQVVGQYEFEDNDKPIKVSHVKPKGVKDETESGNDMKQAGWHCIKPEKKKDGNYMEDDCQRKNGAYGRPSRAREVLDPVDHECSVFEEKNSKYVRKARCKIPLYVNWEPVGIDAEDWHDDDTIYSMSSRVEWELDPICHEDNVIEQPKSQDDNIDRNTLSPFIKRESNDIEAEDWHHNATLYKRSSKVQMYHKGESRQAVAQYEFGDNDKPTKVPHVKPKGIKDENESGNNRKQAVAEEQFDDRDKPIKVPPYVKPKAVKNVTNSNDWLEDGIVIGRSAKARKDADIPVHEGHVVAPLKSNPIALHLIPPPYVKRNVSGLTDHVKSSSSPNNECGFAASDKSDSGGCGDPQKDELVADDERLKPLSVTREHHKSPVVQVTDNTVDVVEAMQSRPRIPHGRRRHSARQSSFATWDAYDLEEELVDRLLVHYSKKKTPRQSRKHKERIQAPLADHAIDGSEARQHQSYDMYYISRPESVQHLHADHADDGKVKRHPTDGSFHAYKPESVQAPANCFVHNVGLRKHQSLGHPVIHKPESTHALPADQVADCREAEHRLCNGGHRLHKSESARSLPVENIDLGAARQHKAYHRYHLDNPESVHPTVRAVSLPPVSINPEENVKGLGLAASLQPDSVSSPGACMHPRPPDYDELAARFALLMRG